MALLLAFLGFASLILIHEAGHMLAAKAVGMKVEKFYLFFPPKLFSFKRGETEYGIGAIPLGGFCSIAGMSEISLEDLEDEDHPRAYVNQPVWKRIVVIAAGPAVNILIAFLLLFGLGFAKTEPTNVIKEVEQGTPAHTLIKPGDRLLAVDGKKVAPLEISKRIAAHACPRAGTRKCKETPVQLKIERNGVISTQTLLPRYDRTLKRSLVGITIATREVDQSPLEAISFSLDTSWEVTELTFATLTRVFEAEERANLSGVVGSYDATRQAFEFSTRVAVFVLALISLSLAIINLLPFLPLDGGHIYWALVEKLRGRRVPHTSMERSAMIGFALIMILFFIGLNNDISRLGEDLIGVR